MTIKPFHPTLLALAAAAVLAGCSLAPRYERPAAPVATQFPSEGAYADSAGQQGAVPAAELGWRDFFTDPQLQALIEIALRNNRDLRVSVLQVAEARAQYRVQRSALLPTLSLDATGTRSRTPADLSYTGRATIGSQYQIGPSASWEIDFFGRVQSLNQAALAQYLATAEARRAATLALIAQVANQYLTVRSNEALLRVTEETLKTSRESLRLAQVQFDTGTGSALDLSEAEGVVRQAEANYASQTRLREQAQNTLVELIGQPLPADLPEGVPLEQQAIIADVPAGLPSDLLLRRPDILQAEQLLLAANANIGAARAAFFPSISLTGSFGTASRQLGGLFKAGSAAWTFSPTISLPIFNGGQNLANLDLAHIEKNIEIAQYEKAIQTAFREVSDGLIARTTYEQQIAALKNYVDSQQRRLQLSNLRYTSGVDSYLSVLTAQTDLYGAQQTLINAELSRLTNLVTLYQKLGGGWLEHTGDTPKAADAPPDYANVDRNGTPRPASAASASAASAPSGG
ncbi:efflux transporter outer membrane subunit [Chitinasiproducens palmae]|uniref:Outer membrane protein, multidrug efflux system n=1 Tax=Chitinasiproducens palmae TaxID=1770053 RepID=A0A1H2PX23_9BURK|nr:efflux transporter outer membrane subunit [Chitinasiproducens palmae]SDV51612.1 outer membrane protein, multidrug efflux system [Chitinasiproducens palmae]